MKKIKREEIYHDNYGWLDTYHHFSFANYHDPNNMNFGDIRVINDDIVKAGNGFGSHPHKNMEIITYLINGEISHGDDMKNLKTIKPNEVQYMSAGTGVFHSEYNHGSEDSRLLQIWINPDKKNYDPVYMDYKYDPKEKNNQFFHLVSKKNEKGLVKINQDVDIFVGEFDKDTYYEIPSGKKIYGLIIDGKVNINNEILETRDAFKEEEGELSFKIEKKSHIMLLQTNK